MGMTVLQNVQIINFQIIQNATIVIMVVHPVYPYWIVVNAWKILNYNLMVLVNRYVKQDSIFRIKTENVMIAHRIVKVVFIKIVVLTVMMDSF